MPNNLPMTTIFGPCDEPIHSSFAPDQQDDVIPQNLSQALVLTSVPIESIGKNKPSTLMQSSLKLTYSRSSISR